MLNNSSNNSIQEMFVVISQWKLYQEFQLQMMTNRNKQSNCTRLKQGEWLENFFVRKILAISDPCNRLLDG